MIIIKIGFIGAGKVGFSLGKYLKENGITVTGYYSNNEDSATEASKFTNTKKYKCLENIISESDAIFITTPDDEIKKVWNKIKKLSIENKLICHCSGSLSSEIFSNINQYSAYGYSIHPMIAISDKYNSYKQLNQAFITIEGHEKHIKRLSSLIRSLGNNNAIINKENKSLYHVASVFSSNLVLGIFNNAIKYLQSCGFKEEDAIKALYPLMSLNITNISERGITNSITGPVERGDIEVIKAHCNVLDKDDRVLYKILSKNLLQIAKEKNKNRDYKELEKYLGGIE